MSYQARILADRVCPIYLLREQPEDGVAKWFYLKLDDGNKTAFQHALKHGSFDCAAYGEVLASGFGENPPSHITWELEAQGAI